MPADSVDLALWEMKVRCDERLNPTAKHVAHVLAERFRIGHGAHQASAESIASDAGMVSMNAVRDALARLRLTGWLASTRVGDTVKHGMEHRPTMSS